MRVKVKLIQKDLLGKEEHIIADGPAILNGNRMVYAEDETGFRHTVTYTDEEMILERGGDFPSRTVLKEGAAGCSTVDSPYGRMVMETRLKKRRKTDDFWLAEYQILSAGEIVLDQQLLWKINRMN